jgi:hypothetical protein
MRWRRNIRPRITKWVVIDASLPGIANWDEVKQSPLLRHFNFRGPDEERLVPDAMPIPAASRSARISRHIGSVSFEKCHHTATSFKALGFSDFCRRQDGM